MSKKILICFYLENNSSRSSGGVDCKGLVGWLVFVLRILSVADVIHGYALISHSLFISVGFMIGMCRVGDSGGPGGTTGLPGPGRGCLDRVRGLDAAAACRLVLPSAASDVCVFCVMLLLSVLQRRWEREREKERAFACGNCWRLAGPSRELICQWVYCTCSICACVFVSVQVWLHFGFFFWVGFGLFDFAWRNRVGSLLRCHVSVTIGLD